MRNQRILLVAMVALLALPAAVFASGAQQPVAAAGALAEIGFRTSGYPIVDTPVTINAVIVRPGHLNTAYKDMTLLNELQDKTNVRIAWEELPESQAVERVNLMFASREFPDVFFNSGGGHNDTNIYTAGRGGDIYPLNDYLEQYAPNWMQVFEDYPLVRTAVTFPVGNI